MTQIEVLLPELRAYARSISENADDSEDLVQDAVERALRSDGCPNRLERMRPWMFRVIRNLKYDELRKRRVRREYLRSQSRLFIDLAQGTDHADSVLIRLVFDQMPTATKEVLFLVDIMGLKYAEAAEVMGVPQGTVMSRISRARKAMLEAIRGGDDSCSERGNKYEQS